MQASDAALAATPSRPYCSHKAAAANVQVSKDALGHVYKTFANVYKVFETTYTVAAANLQASDASLAATPTRLKYIRPLQLYCSHNEMASNVQVSDTALANV